MKENKINKNVIKLLSIIIVAILLIIVIVLFVKKASMFLYPLGLGKYHTQVYIDSVWQPVYCTPPLIDHFSYSHLSYA